MSKILHSRSLYISLAIIAIIAVVAMAFRISNNAPEPLITNTVELGDVRQLVSVSGIAEAEQSADLAFPVSGIVSSVLVSEGDVVEVGDILVTLENRALLADRQDALANIRRAVAQRDELLSGPSESERDVTSNSVDLALQALDRTKENETRKVTNAKRLLLSSNLTAFSNDYDEDATPPTISGTYSCDNEGTYTIEVFRSGAQSGFSYRLSGLENGTFVGSVDQAIALGACGLRIQFDENSNYYNTDWQIEIPNTKSSSYTTTLNAYNLAVTQAASAIALAEQDVLLAEANARNNNAPPRIEEIARANADIAQAQARLARIDSEISDRILRAPFAGTITEIDILPGETVSNAPILNLLAASEFEVTARIPEIDIGKLSINQRVEMVFDTRSNETITGVISFISLKATEIDGVAYYEALIKMDEVPDWIRSGLNADIEVIIEEETDALRVPRRFIINTDGIYSVRQMRDTNIATTTVEVLLEGNDGFYAITGLNEGDTIVAPE